MKITKELHFGKFTVRHCQETGYRHTRYWAELSHGLDAININKIANNQAANAANAFWFIKRFCDNPAEAFAALFPECLDMLDSLALGELAR